MVLSGWHKNMFLKLRRYQPAVTATPDRSSCCTLSAVSMLYSRLKSGSRRARFTFPNSAGSWYSGSSLFWGTPSRFVASAAAEQLVVPGIRSQSFQASVCVTSAIGFSWEEYAVITRVKYLPTLNLSAVFALPNRSYETPRRGDQSGPHFGTSVVSANVRAGTKRPAPTSFPSTLLLSPCNRN